MFKKLFFISFVFYVFPIWSLETVTKEVHLKTDSKQLAQKSALDELSREVVIDMIGEDKYNEEKSKIEKSILKNRNRYILSTRASKPVSQDNGDFSFMVTATVSKDNLKKLLLDNNLFYSSKGSFCLIPVVSFSTHFQSKEKTYSWWLASSGDKIDPVLQKMAVSFFDLLSQELIKQGFYLLNPIFQRMNEGTPSSVLPGRRSRVRDFVPLSEFYTCDIILSGHIQSGNLTSQRSSILSHLFSSFSNKSSELVSSFQYFTNFSFRVFNIRTRQFLFKLSKRFPFSSSDQQNPEKEMLLNLNNILDSFIYQLSSYQEEGSLGLNRMTVSVQGPLSYAEKEQLKKALIKNISGIQNLQERMLSSSRVVYEADSSSDIRSLAKQLRAVSLRRFVIQVKGYRKQELEIYARKRK